jgi:hypothetical protein
MTCFRALLQTRSLLGPAIYGFLVVFCGDARRRQSFEVLLSGETAQLAFVDPPYNVKIRGHVSGNGRVQHREFMQASGEKTSAQFTKFLEESLDLPRRTLRRGRHSFHLL